MLCGILEQTNNTTASAGHKHWQPPSPSTQEAALQTGVWRTAENTHATLRQHSRPHIQTCHIQDIRSGGLHFLKSMRQISEVRPRSDC